MSPVLSNGNQHAVPTVNREPEQIGQEGQPVFALSFRAGGFDTVMQLGVIHAFLVSQRRAPDVVAGVSAGAINAAALAEILREPDEKDQVGRFREFLNAYRDAPRDFISAFLPDTYEIDAQAPLESLKLPIHCQDERNERDASVRSKTGLIRLFNTLLSLRISIGVMTRLIHCILKYSAAAEKPAVKRAWARFGIALEMLTLVLFNLPRISPLSWQVLMTLVNPSVGKGAAEYESGSHWQRMAGKIRRFFTVGMSAGQIISFRKRSMRTIGLSFKHLYALLFSFVIWLLAFLFWLCAPVLMPISKLFAPIGRWLRARMASSRSLSLGQRFLRRFLRRFDLDRELADSYPLKQILVRLFDPGYYGGLKKDEVIEHALCRDEGSASRSHNPPKALRSYAQNSNGRPRIHVAPVVTALSDGTSLIPPPHTSVVDALLAATAVAPFFKPIRVGTTLGKSTYCIDAVNVANEPTIALIDYLRDRVKNASGVYICPVSSFPTRTPSIPNGTKGYTRLVDIVLRVLELRRCQNANLEHKLTRLYTKLLPTSHHRIGDKTYIAAQIFPIEPEQPLRVNESLASARTGDEKEQIVFEAIAAGCRATLEVLVKPHIQGDGRRSVLCRDAIERLGAQPLYGSNGDTGPGLREVCRHCHIHLPGKSDPTKWSLYIRDDTRENHEQKTVPEGWLIWPHKDPTKGSLQTHNDEQPRGDDVTDTPIPQAESPTIDQEQPTRELPSDQAPWVSLLFSGGVFRGVFQVGVVNALEQVNLSPRLFAGSSVGSIMAAMAARVFADPPEKRPARILDVASTFMALDRLILTDRFADFVRGFTIRAASAGFSFHDMDELFRRYDAGHPARFNNTARRVTAGIERLLYVSPFELVALVKAIRLQQMSKARRLVRQYIQELLERYHTRLELLGAEPLALLVAHNVLDGWEQGDERKEYAEHPHRAPFRLFEKNGQYLIATATNLQAGTLKTIGTTGSNSHKEPNAMLLEALLGSSAFPAVFRPRRSSEIFPLDEHDDQYVDGGIMDNLPLDAVVEFLDKAPREYRIARRPVNGTVPVPHLLLTGSLEPEFIECEEDRIEQICSLWPLLLKRIEQLSYNRKVEMFAMAQQDFRKLYQDKDLQKRRQERANRSGVPPWEPLDIEVVTVKPKWLCSTFGFHPMLGFRRRKQAASIAHGCASTLATLHRALSELPEPRRTTYKETWGITLKFDGGAIIEGEARTEKLTPHDPGGLKQANGWCWFRSDSQVCPFSRQGLADLTRQGLYEGLSQTRRELQMIYELCGCSETHRATSEL